MAVALSYVLSFVILWQAPMGGQVSLEPVPILVLALWRGCRVGTLAGSVEGALHFLRENLAVHPLSLLLDYPIAGAALGLAGVLGKPHPMWRAAVGVGLAVSAKFAVHVISGYVFYAQAQQGWAAWVYSLEYNAVYMLPQLVICVFIVPPLARRLWNR